MVDEFFWSDLKRFGSQIALICARSGEQWTFTRLAASVEHVASEFATARKALIFLRLNNEPADVIRYLGALHSGNCVYLYNPALSPEKLRRLIKLYEPGFIVGH